MELWKTVTITLSTRQQKRHWCIEESYGLCGRGRRWEDVGEWHWNKKYWCIYGEKIQLSPSNQRSHPVEVYTCREEWVSIRTVRPQCPLAIIPQRTYSTCIPIGIREFSLMENPLRDSLRIPLGFWNPRILEKRFNHPVWVEYLSIDSSLKSPEWDPSLLTMAKYL